MKKLLLLLLCVPLMFSCGENEEKNNTEDGESNKEKLHNTETENSRIEVDESGEIYLRNISKTEKYQFTLSVLFGDCKMEVLKDKYWGNIDYWSYTDEELISRNQQDYLKSKLPGDIYLRLFPLDTIPMDMDTSLFKIDISLKNNAYQEFLTLNPGERIRIGYDCHDGVNYPDIWTTSFRNHYFSRDPPTCYCNDTSKITYSVMGELRVD